MAIPQFLDEVQVILSAIDPPDSLGSPSLGDRHLVMTEENPTIPIGRTSKRDAKLEPARNNAWIDSAVISRAHAILHFDADQKKVFIKDVGSLHGTFRNGFRLPKNKLQVLEQGDTLRFGIAVERSAQAFPPTTMRVLINHGTEPRPESKSVVFRVPDDTDVEDLASDDDFSIWTSIRVLRENGIHPTQLEAFSTAPPIDLTSEEENEFNFSDIQAIEGQCVEHGEWGSCSSVLSPTTSAILAPPAMLHPAVTALADAPAKGENPANRSVQGGGKEPYYSKSVDLDKALGFDLATANLPANLPSLTVDCDKIGLAQQELVVATNSVPPTQYWVDPDSTVMFSSPAARSTRGLEMQPPRDSSPVLDETSAYQFELSKKAAAATAKAKESDQTHFEAHAYTKRPSSDQSSHKRKAEDISELPPEERSKIELCKEQTRTSPSEVFCSAHASSWKALVHKAAEDSHANKRLRRAAEVFGYAALGGVAVMSALIATAPAL